MHDQIRQVNDHSGKVNGQSSATQGKIKIKIEHKTKSGQSIAIQSKSVVSQMLVRGGSGEIWGREGEHGGGGVGDER